MKKITQNNIEEIHSLLREQVARQKTNTAQTMRILFENLSFEERYHFQGSASLDLCRLFHVMLLSNQVITGHRDVLIEFQGCEIELLEHSAEPNLTILAQNCAINRLLTKDITSSKMLNLNNCRINYCRVGVGRYEGTLFAVNTSFTKIDCRKVTFVRPINFLNCYFGDYAGVNKTVIFSDTNFVEGVDFSHSKFVQAPCFFGTQFHLDTEFSECEFQDVTSQYAWRAYRALKETMLSRESDHEAQLFHSLELEARYNTVLPKGFKIFTEKGMETISSWLLKRWSNYGRNLWLPLVALLLLADIMTLVYALGGGTVCGNVERIGWINEHCKQPTVFLYALRNMFGPFGLAMGDEKMFVPVNSWVKTFGFIQLMSSSVIWFIWIRQILSKFKF